MEIMRIIKGMDWKRRLQRRMRRQVRTGVPVFAGVVFAALCLTAAVQSPVSDAEEAIDKVDPAVEEALRARFSNPDVGFAVNRIENSELPGIYRVWIEQGPMVYATPDGGFFLLGDLFQLGDEGLVNLAEQRRSEDRRDVISEVPMDEQIVFAADGEVKTHITVFTDVSCFYCQKLHKEVPALNRSGVEVRYLAYPRQGIGSDGFRQLASAWCSKDRQLTLTRLKNREALRENVCPGNPVAEQFALGQQLGVRGTPAIVMPTGEMIPGFKTADDLLALLGLE